MRRIILDLFAGPGGWSHALTGLGARDIGLEWDEWACKTRAKAGQLTIRTDVAPYPAWIFCGRILGLIASPPCQAWSMAGKRLGLVDQPLVHQSVADLAAGRDTREQLLGECADKRSLLTAEPTRYLHALNLAGEPEWVVMEGLRGRPGLPAGALRLGRPAPCQREPPADTPAPTFAAEAHRWSWSLRSNNQSNATVRRADEAAGTLFFGHRANECTWVADTASDVPDSEQRSAPAPIKITAQEAGVLQSFPADYP
ncbi:DNA cytosine methyltransferase [Streptomyces sp. NBC_00485]|uniref:DNA cytosine methyltransferase n=1 Tax=Streptomyces sp. NBC_00485 TaxID=2975758 RepID=UPI003FA742D5